VAVFRLVRRGGLLGVLAAMALLAVFGLALMYIISRTGIAEMDAVLVPSNLRFLSISNIQTF